MSALETIRSHNDHVVHPVYLPFHKELLGSHFAAVTGGGEDGRHVRFDVLLDVNPKLQPPLPDRDPARTCFVLLTPQLLKDNPTSRLYGSLLSAYQDETSGLLGEHLPHRTSAELTGVPGRLGWTTFEECNRIAPGACGWL